MLKPKFYNVILFFFLKYIIFYTFLMIKHKDFKLLEWDNIVDGHSLVYFILVMMPLCISSMVLFSVPTYYSFKVHKPVYLMLTITAVFMAEYFLYVYFTSQKNPDSNGIYNIIVSGTCFTVLFYRRIIEIFTT